MFLFSLFQHAFRCAHMYVRRANKSLSFKSVEERSSCLFFAAPKRFIYPGWSLQLHNPIHVSQIPNPRVAEVDKPLQ